MASRQFAVITKASFVVVILALCACNTIARADNGAGEPRQPDAAAERTAERLPPARVILPAPWEQAAPVRPAVAPTDRK